MKYFVCYLITKPIDGESLFKCMKDLESVIPSATKVLVLYSTKEPTRFIQNLPKYGNIEIAKIENAGEVYIYKAIVERACKENYDFLTILQPHYAYTEGGYNALIKILESYKGDLPAVLTPVSVLDCDPEIKEEKELRPIMGCRLLGTMLNLSIYQKTKGFNLSYYQSTFDYEYCLDVRQLNYQVVLATKIRLNLRDYFMYRKKKLFFVHMFSYNKDAMELYYETRNRHYLWDKYRKLDPKYVKLDKKIYRKELRAMRQCDPAASTKYEIIFQAIDDYRDGVKGKMKGE